MTKSLVVVQKNDHSLGFYDFASGKATARVALAPYPHEFVLSADRRYAMQSHFGVALAEDQGPGGDRISIVDLHRQEVVGHVDCGCWRRPHGIALDGRDRLFVLSEAADRLLVAADPFSGRFDTDQSTGGAGSHIVTVTRDGKTAFCSNMKSHDLSILYPEEPARKPLLVETGSRPEGSTLDATEQRLYVACRESAEIIVIETRSGTITERIPTPPGPVRLCWDRRGRLLVALYHARALAVIDIHAAGTEFTLDLPDQPVSIGYDPETDQALCSTLGDEVCVIDLANRRLTNRIATRPGPDPMAVVDIP